MKINYYTSMDPRRLLNNNTQFKTLADTAFELGQPGEMFELVADQEQTYNTDIIQVRRSLKLTGKFQATFELHGRINVTIENAQIMNASFGAAQESTGTIILASDFEGSLAIINSQVKYSSNGDMGLAIWRQSGDAVTYTANLMVKDSTIDGLADITVQASMQGNVSLIGGDAESQCNGISSTNWQLNNVNLKIKYGYLINNALQPTKVKQVTCLTGPIIFQGNWDIDTLSLDQKEPSESFKFIGVNDGINYRVTQISVKNLVREHTPVGSSAFYADTAELNFNNAKLGQSNDQLQASIANCKITMNHTSDNLQWVLEGDNVLKVDKASLTSLHQRESEFVDQLPEVKKVESDDQDDLFGDLDTASANTNGQAKTDDDIVRDEDPKIEKQDAGTDISAKGDTNKIVQQDGLAQLNAMIGLDSVKKKVHDYAEVAKFNAYARKHGLKETTGMNRHMIFGGNPGTGKTTVAKYIAQILYECGALPSNKLTSVGVRDLVGDHKGETAKSTHKIVDDALGGVLLIDEAYRLNDHGDSFGEEAIGELTQVIDDKKYRDNLIIILAGYSKPMKDLLNNVNPGFRSRFNNWIEFPDYSTADKIKIFQKDCKDNGILMNKKLLKTKVFLWLLKFYSRDHANGRSVRNMFDSLTQARVNRVTPQLSKLSDEKKLTDQQKQALMTITGDDIKTVYHQARETLKREKEEKAQEKAKKLAAQKKGLDDDV